MGRSLCPAAFEQQCMYFSSRITRMPMNTVIRAVSDLSYISLTGVYNVLSEWKRWCGSIFWKNCQCCMSWGQSIIERLHIVLRTSLWPLPFSKRIQLYPWGYWNLSLRLGVSREPVLESYGVPKNIAIWLRLQSGIIYKGPASESLLTTL